MKVEIAQQADDMRNILDELDSILDTVSNREAANLLEVYKSINIILKSQLCTLKDRPSLRVVKE